MLFLPENSNPASLIAPSANLTWNIGGELQNGLYNNVFLQSFSLGEFEITDTYTCFDDVSHIFAFGKDIDKSYFSVRMIVFVGLSCKTGATATISDLKSKYDSMRIYERKGTPVSISISDVIKDTSGYLIGMTVGDIDPATHACSVSFQFIINQGR